MRRESNFQAVFFLNMKPVNAFGMSSIHIILFKISKKICFKIKMRFLSSLVFCMAPCLHDK